MDREIKIILTKYSDRRRGLELTHIPSGISVTAIVDRLTTVLSQRDKLLAELKSKLKAAGYALRDEP